MGAKLPALPNVFPGPQGRPKTRPTNPARRLSDTLITWVPHFICFICRSGAEHDDETAFELVSRACFEFATHRLSSPTRWNGSGGEVRPEICKKNKILIVFSSSGPNGLPRIFQKLVGSVAISVQDL